MSWTYCGSAQGSCSDRPDTRSRLGLALALLAIAAPGGADPVQQALGSGVQLRCVQLGDTRLGCDYRLLRPAPVNQVSARVGGVALPDPVATPRAKPSGSSALFILVDTSDPARRPAVEKSIEHINTLLDAADTHHQFGLGAFDSDLVLLADIGSSRPDVRAKASELSAGGRTTELYRNAVEAIRLLKQTQAERRALVIMSDGLAEDRAYFHHDVVAAAQAAGIVIYGIGYPRSVSLSVGLQSLRRLAEETGGLYAGTGPGFELPQGFARDLYATLDNGGRLTLDFEAAIGGGLYGEQELELAFSLADGQAVVTLPLSLPGAAPGETIVKVVEVQVPKLVEVPTVIEVPAAVATGPVTNRAGAEAVAIPAMDPPPSLDSHTVWLWYVLVPGALLVALALTLLLGIKTRRAEKGDLASTGPSKAARSLAFLESLNGDNQRHAVTRAAYRIGRHSDNDLSIRDASVSRQHAEIHRKRDASFTISDLDSMNGVFVNHKKIDSVALFDNDLVEIGDKSFRFRMKEHAEPTGEHTLAQDSVDRVTPLRGVGGRQ